MPTYINPKWSNSTSGETIIINPARNNRNTMEEAIKIEGSKLMKDLLDTTSIEQFINDERVKKRIWLLRKYPNTIQHDTINHIMNVATDDEINQMVLERTMELAND